MTVNVVDRGFYSEAWCSHDGCPFRVSNRRASETVSEAARHVEATGHDVLGQDIGVWTAAEPQS